MNGILSYPLLDGRPRHSYSSVDRKGPEIQNLVALNFKLADIDEMESKEGSQEIMQH